MAKRKRIDPQEKRAAIYIRVSTKWQAEDGDSLPMQREELPKYVEYALGIKKYEIFEDAGFSAKNTDRPDYQLMMSRVRQGEFSHIVVWKLDRISRNLLDFAAMYAELKSLGVVFISKNEQFDTSTAIGEAMLKIILVFAELERNMTSERVAATLISRAQGGQWNGGRVPFGYDHEKGSEEFTINEKEAATVRLIYDLYEQGRSLLSIAQHLNENGYGTRSGIPWSPTTVHKMLTSPFYVGSYRYNFHDEGTKQHKRRSEKEWVTVPDHHPAIIEESRQKEIVKTLQSKNYASVSFKTYSRKHVHIFAGLLECGQCGSQFQATIDKARAGSGWRPSIYLCSRHRRFKDCENKYVSDVTLGPFILNFVSNYLRAQRNFGRTTTVEILEKKLLRGEYFVGVSLDADSVRQIHKSFRAARFGDVDFLPNDGPDTSDMPTEKEILDNERRRLERALQRLKTLFLYSEEAMAEQDFISQNAELSERLEKVNSRLSELISSSQGSEPSTDDDTFMQQASFLVITEELLSRRFVNYEKVIRALDRKTLKEFMDSIIQKIVIFDGKTTELVFKNGISVKFLYS
ncbi:MAG: recombinase family protein [Clostridia bacterium]|nr:recombinase family protein [Clostridia bacterium]